MFVGILMTSWVLQMEKSENDTKPYFKNLVEHNAKEAEKQMNSILGKLRQVKTMKLRR